MKFRSAFTLIELMLAVLLLALLASAAALSFSGPLKTARSHDAIEQIRSFDAAARDAALRSGATVRIEFDLSADTLSRREGTERQSLRCQTTLPAGYRIEEARVGGQTVSYGVANIDVSTLGLTRSYGLRLAGPGLDQWVMFAGLTGQMTQVQNESTLDSILSKTAPSSYRVWDVRRATTLIEVLAGLVVLGTLLASVAVARGRFLRQWADADRQLAAARAVDVMLATWLAAPQGSVRVPADGPLDGVPNDTWQTRILPDISAEQLGALHVRLEIFDRNARQTARSPALAVEFLLHKSVKPHP